MNLKDKLASLKKQAEDIKGAVESGDAKAMEKAASLVTEIEEVKAAIKKAEQFDAALKGIGAANAEDEQTEQKAARTLGDFVAQRVKAVGKPEKSAVSYGTFGEKAAGDVMVKPTAVDSALADVEERLYEGPRRRLTVADLFAQETTTRSAITYFVESATVEGAPAFTAENGTKPGVTFGEPTAVTEPVKKLAAVYHESDELLDDLPWLATSINNRGIYMHCLTKENALLNGSGTGNNIKGVLNREGILSQKLAKGETNAADALFRAMTDVETNSGFTADGIVINPADYQALRLTKDSNGQYFGGGFFSGQYGNGATMDKPPLWGVPTVVTSAIPAGTALVGAFKLGGSVISRKGMTVEIANQNKDDFENNRVSIRIEERLALAVRYPAAFCKVDLSAPAAQATGK